MGYDEKIAARVREVLAGQAGVVEKKMFGGLTFMVGGSMAVGVIGEDLMVRVGPARNDEALAVAHARPMDFTGKPMAGYVYVAPAGVRTRPSLERWIRWGVEHAASLPAKRAPPRRRDKA